MKRSPFLIFLFFWYFALSSQIGFAQTEIDASLAAKITVSGFCLCKTTLQDLQRLDSDLKLIDVEEMNGGKKCFGEDARFVKWERLLF